MPRSPLLWKPKERRSRSKSTSSNTSSKHVRRSAQLYSTSPPRHIRNPPTIHQVLSVDTLPPLPDSTPASASSSMILPPPGSSPPHSPKSPQPIKSPEPVASPPKSSALQATVEDYHSDHDVPPLALGPSVSPDITLEAEQQEKQDDQTEPEPTESAPVEKEPDTESVKEQQAVESPAPSETTERPSEEAPSVPGSFPAQSPPSSPPAPPSLSQSLHSPALYTGSFHGQPPKSAPPYKYITPQVPYYHPSAPGFQYYPLPGDGYQSHAMYPHPMFPYRPHYGSGPPPDGAPLQRHSSRASRGSAAGKPPYSPQQRQQSAGPRRSRHEPGGEDGDAGDGDAGSAMGADDAALIQKLTRTRSPDARPYGTEDSPYLLDSVQSAISHLLTVSTALPDIDLLVKKHRQTYEQLGKREDEIRLLERRQDEWAKRLETHINERNEQRKQQEENIEGLEKDLAASEEREKGLQDEKTSNEALIMGLKAQMEDNAKKTDDEIAALKSGKEDLEKQKVDLEESLKGEETKVQELDEKLKASIGEKEQLEKTSQEELEKLRQEFDQWKVVAEEAAKSEKEKLQESHKDEKREMTDRFDTQVQSLKDEHQKHKEEFNKEKELLLAARVQAEGRITELTSEFEKGMREVVGKLTKENEAVREDAAKQKQELNALMESQAKDMNAKLDAKQEALNEIAKAKILLEEEVAKLRKEFEDKLAAKEKLLEDSLTREREARSTWEKERDDLTKGWAQERAAMSRGWEEGRQVLVNQHKQEKSDIDKVWAERHGDAIRKGVEERSTLQTQLSALLKQREDERSRYEKVKGELLKGSDSLEKEKARLQKMVESFGEVTDVKSKGDQFFIDAFTNLTNQIITITSTHINSVPSDSYLPKLLPPSLPTISNTSASITLLRAYGQHLISLTLVRRIFSPFLFSNEHNLSTDSLFTSLANDLRLRDPKKEASWRRATLWAAYTATKAKASINAAAGNVVEEILASLKPLIADWDRDNRETRLRDDVRAVVKCAAEAWRYARLERELVRAWMPGSTADALPPDPSSSSNKAAFLLPVLPTIVRDATNLCFVENASDHEDRGCVYVPGVAIFTSSPAIVTRCREIEAQAGSAPNLPPYKERPDPRMEKEGLKGGDRALSPLVHNPVMGKGSKDGRKPSIGGGGEGGKPVSVESLREEAAAGGGSGKGSPPGIGPKIIQKEKA